MVFIYQCPRHFPWFFLSGANIEEKVIMQTEAQETGGDGNPDYAQIDQQGM
jgi:hypothetical protein